LGFSGATFTAGTADFLGSAAVTLMQRSISRELELGTLKRDTQIQVSLFPGYRDNVKFICHDIRKTVIDGPFHMILCRNLVFTYFDNTLQLGTVERL